MTYNAMFNKYIFENNLGNKKTKNEKQAYCFGFFDGYYNERTYKDYVFPEEPYKNAYLKGFYDSKNEEIIEKENIGMFNKKQWLYKLAYNDYKNKIIRMNLSYDSQLIYDQVIEDMKNSKDPLNLEPPIISKNIRF